MKIDPGEVAASKDRRRDMSRIREGGSIAGAYRNRWRHWIWQKKMGDEDEARSF